MNAKKVSVDDIRAEDSVYRFDRPVKWSGDQGAMAALERSLDELGVTAPLLAHDVNGDGLHLVDGFKRYAWAVSRGVDSVPCAVLPQDTPLTKTLDVVFWECRDRITASAVGKARYAMFAIDAGASREEVIAKILPLMELEPHPKILRGLETICGLPEEAIGYLAEKRFSLKQLAAIARYPRELVSLVFSWRDRMALTASIVEELLENIKDYMRAGNISTEDFVRNEDVAAILSSDAALQEKTRMMREHVRRLRYPTLVSVNEELEKIKNNMGLPRSVDVRWDRTLEMRELNINVKAENPEELNEAVSKLSSTAAQDGARRLFEKL